jgi:gamma-glutamyltranspeptidase/glutathione hydrolase
VIIGVVDRGLGAQAAIEAPRVHLEGDVVYTEPDVDLTGVEAPGRTVIRFGAPNLFFGGAQAVVRDPRSGVLEGGCDPRRGGAVAVA